jgi:hypothetical protein
MRQRDYYKMKEKLGEGYHPMGKKASYNDAVPNVKIILQHNRGLEEGEQRYRNVAKIFLENQDGERFLAPTTRPGIARVYARHIAEGGVPNDERWNHIKSICEEYNQMAGFVRATRNKEFNESALHLVQEGANHYGNLRETLSKLAGHRGYHAYFESYTPALMEDEDDTNINELFVQETMDPRIESVMPILSRLHKKVSETAVPEVNSLAEWADSVINEKLDMDDKKTDKKQDTKQVNNQEKDDDSEEKSIGAGPLSRIKDQAEKKMSGKLAKSLGIQEGDVAEMDKSPEANPYSGQGHRKGDDHAGKPQHTAKIMAAKQAVKMARKTLDKAFKGDVDENFISMAPQAVAEKEMDSTTKSLAVPADKMLEAPGAETLSHNQSTEKSNLKAFDLAEVDMGQADRTLRHTPRGDDNGKMSHITSLSKAAKKMGHDSYADVPDNAVEKLKTLAKKIRGGDDVSEDLDANQKRVGQLGPTEKVKNNNIGKLVGANESTEIDPALARIIEMARFKR